MRRFAIVGVLVSLSIVGAVPAKDGVRLRPSAPILVDATGGAIKQPEGVACGGNTVLIADTGNARLLRFAVEGDVMTAGSAIELPELPRPTRLALSSKGEIFAVDSKLRRVARISAAGEFVGYLDLDDGASGFASAPRSVAIDRNDNLYVLDTYAEQVVVLTPAGETARRIGFPAEYGFLADIGVDPGGRVFAVDSVRKEIFSAAPQDKNLTSLADELPEDLEFPAGIAVGAGGNLFVSDQSGGSIVVLGRDGAFRGRQSAAGWKAGRLRYPTALCADEQGDLFVADRESNRVQVFFVLQ